MSASFEDSSASPSPQGCNWRQRVLRLPFADCKSKLPQRWPLRTPGLGHQKNRGTPTQLLFFLTKQVYKNLQDAALVRLFREQPIVAGTAGSQLLDES